MIVTWADLAFDSYDEEVSFILRKWNIKEVENFTILVFDFIKTLKSGTIQGRATNLSSIYFYVISKQTILYYQIINKETIELLLFWNNQKDPKILKAILSNI